MPAGVRLVETSLLREYKREILLLVLPEDLQSSLGRERAWYAYRLTILSESRLPLGSNFNFWLVSDDD